MTAVYVATALAGVVSGLGYHSPGRWRRVVVCVDGFVAGGLVVAASVRIMQHDWWWALFDLAALGFLAVKIVVDYRWRQTERVTR